METDASVREAAPAAGTQKMQAEQAHGTCRLYERDRRGTEILIATEPVNNQDTMLDAMVALRRRNPQNNCHIMCVGAGD